MNNVFLSEFRSNLHDLMNNPSSASAFKRIEELVSFARKDTATIALLNTYTLETLDKWGHHGFEGQGTMQALSSFTAPHLLVEFWDGMSARVQALGEVLEGAYIFTAGGLNVHQFVDPSDFNCSVSIEGLGTHAALEAQEIALMESYMAEEMGETPEAFDFEAAQEEAEEGAVDSFYGNPTPQGAAESLRCGRPVFICEDEELTSSSVLWVVTMASSEDN